MGHHTASSETGRQPGAPGFTRCLLLLIHTILYHLQLDGLNRRGSGGTAVTPLMARSDQAILSLKR